MPTYTYRCDTCGESIDRRQSFSDDPLTTCEACGGALRRVIYPAGIVFKGSGWYVTDYRDSNGAKKSDAEDGSGEKAASDGANKPSESTSGDKSDTGAKEAAATTSSDSGSKETKAKPAASTSGSKTATTDS